MQFGKKGENGRKMRMKWNKRHVLCMPGTAEQPEIPEPENEEYDLPDEPAQEETTLQPTISPEPTEAPTVTTEEEPVSEPTVAPEPTETPIPTATPAPTATPTPTPEPTEAPLVEIEDEETPLSGGVNGLLSDVLDGASYIGNLYNESLYADVRPLAEFYTKDNTLGKGTMLMIVGGTLMLSATIVMIGAALTRRARRIEEKKWK